MPLGNGFGRLMRVDPERAYTQAPALIGQGTARDLMAEGILRLPVEVVPMLRCFVHDELVFSVPRAELMRSRRRSSMLCSSPGRQLKGLSRFTSWPI